MLKLFLSFIFIFLSLSVVRADTINVPVGGNLQSAIDAAKCGDTISLAKADYIGNFRLRNKGCTAANPITITTQGFSVPPGQRITPADYASMAKILTPGNGLPVLEADSGAGWYKLIGLEFGVNYGTDPNKQYHSSFLIVIGNGNDSNPNYGDALAHDITFDRVHAAGKFGDSRFAFAVSGFRLSFINGVVDEFANPPGNDSACFWFPNAGGHLIENSRMSCGMWMIDFGGADSDSPNRGKVVSGSPTQVTLSGMEGNPPAVGDLVAFYIRPPGGEAAWTANTPYPIGTLQFHHSNWTKEVGKPPLLFYVIEGGTSGTTQPDWSSFDEYHNQTKKDGTVTWRLFNGNHQVGRVKTANPSTTPGLFDLTIEATGPTGIFLPPVVGSIAKWNGYNPSLISRRNHYLRPSHWANFNAPNKGMVQVKNADGLLFEGDFWEVQPGRSPNEDFNRNHRPGLFALTPGNQSYSAPWSTAKNVTFRYNRARHIESVFNWALNDYTKTATPGCNNIAHDNLFEDVWHGFVVQANGGCNVAFKHNTVLNQSEQPIKLFGDKLNGLIYEDNIVGWHQGAYLEFGDLFSQNVITGREGGNVFIDKYDRTSEGYSPKRYFPNSLVAKTFEEIKIQADGRLEPDSPFKGKGTNGSDPGANIDLIEAAMGGKLPAPTPSATPTPQPTATPTPVPSPSVTPTPQPTPVPTPPTGSTVNISGYVYVGQQRAGDVTVSLVSGGSIVSSTVSRAPDGFFGFSSVPLGAILRSEGAADQVVMKADTYFVNISAGTPTPTPTPVPSPSPSPTPAPSPTTCTMTVDSPTLPQWGSGKLVVTFTGLTQTGTVKAVSTSGQITVDTTPKTVSGTSMIAEFWLQAKRKSGNVTVSGPCGSKTVMVGVQ